MHMCMDMYMCMCMSMTCAWARGHVQGALEEELSMEMGLSRRMYEERGKRIEELGKTFALLDQKVEVLLALATRDLPGERFDLIFTAALPGALVA